MFSEAMLKNGSFVKMQGAMTTLVRLSYYIVKTLARLSCKLNLVNLAKLANYMEALPRYTVKYGMLWNMSWSWQDLGDAGKIRFTE